MVRGGLAVACVGISFAATNALARTATFNLDHEHAPGQLIVKFKDGVSAESHLVGLKSIGVASVEAFSRSSGATLLTFSEKGTVKDLAARAAALAKHPDVAWVEANTILRLVGTAGRMPNDADFAKQYALLNDGSITGSVAGADIKATEAWNITTGSKRVLVGVIDTGVDYAHPDIAPNYWTNPGESGTDAQGRDKSTNGVDDDNNGFVDDVRGWNFVGNNNNPTDDHNHGTHCAGVIGASTNNSAGIAGVAWDVSIVGIKFLSASGGGTLVDAVKSIEYATKIGVTMTSNSWGGGGYSETMAAAITDAKNKGILFIAAAGNDADNNDSGDHYPSGYQIDNVIAVAATDSKDQLASFSNYGANTVHVAAPGVAIYSTVKAGAYMLMSGTSMATPHVSGVAALIKAAYPDIEAAKIKERLINSSDYMNALDGKVIAAGRVNAWNALQNDSVAPGEASDLQVIAATRDSFTMSWIAAGDDGDAGLAKAYEIRYSASPINTDAEWRAATKASAQLTLPQSSGGRVQAIIRGLSFNSSGFVAVRAKDKVGNIGAVSDSVPFAVQRVRIVATQPTTSLEGVTVTGDWGIETVTAMDNMKVFSDSPAGNYKDNAAGALTTSMINVPSSAVSLTMRTFHSLEANYDFGFVEVSTDNGTTWKQVDRLTGRSPWVTKSYDLMPHLGGATSFVLRFRMTSDYSIPDDGWKITDITFLGAD